jgi:hypothetical protein
VIAGSGWMRLDVTPEFRERGQLPSHGSDPPTSRDHGSTRAPFVWLGRIVLMALYARRMVATAGPETEFTFRKAIENWCFLQVPLMDVSAFCRASEKRGLLFTVLSGPDALETLDREDLLPPVGYAREPVPSGFEVEALQADTLLLREESGFVPWARIGEPRYCHWHLLTVAEISDSLTIQYPLTRVRDGVDRYSNFLLSFADGLASRRVFERHTPYWRWRELILTRTQSLFLPLITGLYGGPSLAVGLDEDPFLWIRRQQREFDYDAAAKGCGLDAAQLSELYDGLASEGQRLDPMRRWFDLADQVRRERQEELTGDARRALDYYHAARVVRGWHSALRGQEPLPDINELVHGQEATRQAQEQLYGRAGIRGNRAALPGILEHFGLYPLRVQLLVEGPSELTALRVLIEEWFQTSLERLGIHPIELRGADQSAKIERLLGDVRTFANYYLLVLDREGKAKTFIDALERAGHIEADAEAWIWNEDLEADNFDIAEICRELRKAAREEDVKRFRLTTDEVRQAKANTKRGLASVATKLAEDRGLRISKPQLAERLARLAIRKPNRGGPTAADHEADGAPVPNGIRRPPGKRTLAATLEPCLQLSGECG